MTTSTSLQQMTREAFSWAENNISQFARNEQQVNYALLVADSIGRGSDSRHVGTGRSGQLLVEGETGTGKTLGYLIPSMLHAAVSGSRAVISTYTLHLQRQILAPGGDFEIAQRIVREITGKTLTVARRVGRQSFIDANRVSEYLGTGEYGDSDELESMLEWLAGDVSGEFQDWMAATGYDLPNGLEQSDLCLTSSSSEKVSGHYIGNVQSAKDADVVLVTHAMLCLAGKCGWRLLHDIESDSRFIGALVVDEADRLPDVAQNLSGAFVSLYALSALTFNAAKTVQFKSTEIDATGKDLWNAVAAAYIPGSENGVVFWQDIPMANREHIKQCVAKFIGAAKPLVAMLRGQMTSLPDVAARDTAKDMIEAWTEIGNINDLLESDDDSSGIALRWSPKREYPSFKSFSLNPAHILKKLWGAYTDIETGEVQTPSKVDCMVLTSATISVPGKEKVSFVQSIGDFGIWESQNPCAGMHASFTPKSFGRARFVFPDPSVPAPFVNLPEDESHMDERGMMVAEVDQDWLAYAAKMGEIATMTGKTLALTGSYRVAGMIADALEDRGINVILHRRGKKLAALVEEVRKLDNVVLISPSAWEGVDCPHLFDNVVIMQLPFRSRDNVQSQALLRHLISKKGILAEKARNIVELNSIVFAIRKFKQGFGRGIRAHDDAFTLWVADPRFPASDMFESDISGVVPLRKVKRASAFIGAIPIRFRKGIGNPFEEGSRMLLKDGSFISTDDLTEEMAA
jgi:ATP-dependent DNA helicase DinG